ncbi:ABC transporter ATP-binding protein [Jiella sp. M17.18]|uniref:ABC transporter ATP-binding protein n=1 Tax=Jiella sp. M17.18 TaxID=3234247 RepID=UPI0034DEFD6E
MAEAAIRLKNVHLTLGSGRSSVHVLKGIDLSVDRGESVGIVGPSGSGKSTLLMVLAGLERADSGEVEIAGRSLVGLSEDALAAFRGQNVGIVFQSFHLIPNMTALENVAVPLELAGAPDAFERAERELANVGLADRTGHYPGALSGGEQQRVAMARALAPEPAILIADEPTGNLDQETGRQVADLLFAERERRGMTMVLVTHDPALAHRCSREIAVRSGTIHDEGGRRGASGAGDPAGEGASGAAGSAAAGRPHSVAEAAAP